MKKTLFSLLFFIMLQLPAQNTASSKWSDLFSYNNVLAIREDGDRLIAATENGIFYYTPASGEITKLSKANGLHEVKITAFDFNTETKTGLVGYKSGAMDVITPEGITYVVDIPIATGYTGDKKINHISITGNQAVISAGYGVSVFDLSRKEFGETAFFIRADGGFEEVREAVIFGNGVYAATASGLKYHELNVTFPVYSTWTVAEEGDISQLASRDKIALSKGNQLFTGDGTSFSAVTGSFQNIRDIVFSGGKLVITDAPAGGNSTVYIYTSEGSSENTVQSEDLLNTTSVYSSGTYLGSKFRGVISGNGEEIKPDGPFSNTSYKINLQGDQLVISTGGRVDYDKPFEPVPNLGYYHYDGSRWNYPEFFLNSEPGLFNVTDAVINPSKPDEVFFTNFVFVPGFSGIYRMENNQFQNKFIVPNPYEIRIIGLTFDDSSQLFASASFPGKIGFYYYQPSSDTFKDVRPANGKSVQKPVTKDGILYILSPYTDGGLLLYDYRKTPSVLNDDRIKYIQKGNNLPAIQVVSTAVDRNDNVWIGTQNGLRVLSNPSSAIDEPNPQTEPIIIEENGVGEELFRDAHILQIEVDSGNQKWVSVDGGGVFYLNSTGEKTISHFTKSNSPLPTNSVTDIKVDKKTGKVYFVTIDGVVFYQGDVLDVTENFGDVLVYPNPVIHTQYKGNVRIRGLAEKTNIRITDAAGNLVHQAVARGGFYEWNLANQRGVRVASGIYFVLMTNADGTDTATAKIAVVN